MLISEMTDFCAYAMHGFLAAVITAAIFGAIGAGSVAVPSTNCYVLDNTRHIHDFSNLVGQLFEYDDEKDADLVVRFCKDIETRSQPGYVDFGRFDSLSYFTASAGYANFVQEYYNGDLRNCEKTYDKLGRTAQVPHPCPAETTRIPVWNPDRILHFSRGHGKVEKNFHPSNGSYTYPSCFHNIVPIS